MQGKTYLQTDQTFFDELSGLLELRMYRAAERQLKKKYSGERVRSINHYHNEDWL